MHGLVNLFVKACAQEGPALAPVVDRVEDVRSLSFRDESIGALLMLNTLEHVADPTRALAEIRRTIRPGGMVVISVPFDFHLHSFPEDYWRFSPQACGLMLEPIGPRLIGALGPPKDPLFVFGVAFPGAPAAEAEARARAVVRRFQADMERDSWVARERRRRPVARWLTVAAPFLEVRRVYRARARLFETRFALHADGETRAIS